MSEKSAGILMYRRGSGGIELLLAHPGGPYWTHKDDGAWSIPKGLYDPGEEPLAAARREFAEEIGSEVDGEFFDLGSLKQPSGKVVHAFGVEGDVDASGATSNHFEMEWPKGSGRMQSFPEIDRAEWFDPETARRKLRPAQTGFIDRLLAELGE